MFEEELTDLGGVLFIEYSSQVITILLMNITSTYEFKWEKSMLFTK